jgi:hypothetical protein
MRLAVSYLNEKVSATSGMHSRSELFSVCFSGDSSNDEVWVEVRLVTLTSAGLSDDDSSFVTRGFRLGDQQ